MEYTQEQWAQSIASAAADLGRTGAGAPSPYRLASIAETMSPDSRTSAGSDFLLDVHGYWSDAIRYALVTEGEQLEDIDRDHIHRDAMCCVPVATYDQWTVWADLGGWSCVDLTNEAGIDSVESHKVPDIALVGLEVIAGRLLSALWVELDDIVAGL